MKLPHRSGLPLLYTRYLVIAIVVELALLLGFSAMINRLYADADNEQFRRFMSGPVALIVEKLETFPAPQQHAALAQLAQRFDYPLQLVDTPHDLNEALQARLDHGQSAYDSQEQLLYVPLAKQDKVLRMGPLQTESTFGLENVDDSLEIAVLWVLFTGLTLGVLLYFYLRPVWRDVVALRTTAEQLAEGELSARAPHSSSPLFKPLTQVLNTMASRLERLVATRQALAHAAAHELRTPIARLRFGLTMLEDSDNDEERDRYRQGMERDLFELEDLVNSIMNYGKLNRGEVQLHPETVDLREWFDDLMELVEPLRPATIRLTLHCPDGSTRFDRRLMYIATRNLLLNAFKYATARVDMHVEAGPGLLTIHVDDDGPGIPEADRAQVFEMFHRLDRSRDRASGGYGLGLAFVKLIAEHHAGSASASASPLGGARMTMEIPQ